MWLQFNLLSNTNKPDVYKLNYQLEEEWGLEQLQSQFDGMILGNSYCANMMEMVLDISCCANLVYWDSYCANLVQWNSYCANLPEWTVTVPI
jgi:hypothetical protein